MASARWGFGEDVLSSAPHLRPLVGIAAILGNLIVIVIISDNYSRINEVPAP